jgi:hypothetical protein
MGQLREIANMPKELSSDRREPLCLGLFISIITASVVLTLFSYQGGSLNFIYRQEAFAANNHSKEKITSYQSTVDAIASLGIFTYADNTGKNIPYHEVLAWANN